MPTMITNDARCTREIKPRIAMAKAAFNKKKNLFTSKLYLNLRKKLVKCYIWSIACCGAEMWTLPKVDEKYLKSCEMWCWRRMEKISWADRVVANYKCFKIFAGPQNHSEVRKGNCWRSFGIHWVS
jgi:hypothetical protein